MQVELAQQHHRQRRSNTDPNRYMNLNISYPLSLSTSNYQLSDPTNATLGTESTELIDFHGSDSASHSSCSVPSSAASSTVHLPLTGTNAVVDGVSPKRRESLLVYDNVRS